MIKVIESSAHEEMANGGGNQWIMAFVQGVGVLHYLNSVISSSKNLQGQNHTDLKKCYCIIVERWWTTSFSHPLLVSHTLQDSKGNRTVVNHAATMFWDTAAIINFISHINHDSLTFIMEVMG